MLSTSLTPLGHPPPLATSLPLSFFIQLSQPTSNPPPPHTHAKSWHPHESPHSTQVFKFCSNFFFCRNCYNQYRWSNGATFFDLLQYHSVLSYLLVYKLSLSKVKNSQKNENSWFWFWSSFLSPFLISNPSQLIQNYSKTIERNRLSCDTNNWNSISSRNFQSTLWFYEAHP